MISDRLLLISLLLVALLLLAIGQADAGMDRCLSTHSFDVCHDALH